MRILLIDDHPIFRAGLELLLRELEPGVEVLHAGTCDEGLRVAHDTALNLAFLDLNLPDCSGLDCLKRMKAQRPTLPVVLISGEQLNRAVIEQALDLRAMGFVPKSENADAIVAALRAALAGGVFLPAALAPGSRAVPADAPVRECGTRGARSIAETIDPARLGITRRQSEVLRYLVQGWPNKQIASKLGISLPVVKKHVSDLLAHCGVVSRTQLVTLVAEQGIAFGPPERSEARDDAQTTGPA